jgi:hypothetical protein
MIQIPKLRPKDVYKWFDTPQPKGIHSTLQRLFDVQIDFPKIAFIDGPSPIWYNPLTIRIEFAYAHLNKNLAANMSDGTCKTVDQYLAMSFAEEDTHYIHDRLTPQNSRKYLDMLLEAMNKQNGKSLVDGLNIGAQIEGVGKIGYQEIISKLNPEYDKEKEWGSILKIAKARFNSISSFLERTNNLGIVNIGIRKFLVQERDKGLVETAYDWADVIYKDIASSAGHKVADIFRERYAGRFGELIRRDLEPDRSLYNIIDQLLDAQGARHFYRFFGIAI